MSELDNEPFQPEPPLSEEGMQKEKKFEDRKKRGRKGKEGGGEKQRQKNERNGVSEKSGWEDYQKKNQEILNKVTSSLRIIQEELSKIQGLQETQSTQISSLSKKVEKFITNTEAELKKLSQELISALNSVKISIDKQMELMESNEELTRRSIELQEATLPKELHLPTPERLLQRGYLEEEEANYANEKYQDLVRQWFEERIRGMESAEPSFEEQGDIYRYIRTYIVHFKLTPETMGLAEELERKLEERRILKRMVRIHQLGGPDAVLQEGGTLTFSRLVGLMNKESVGEDVEIEFRNYERMGRILRQRRDELNQINQLLKRARGNERDILIARKEKLEKEIDTKVRYIRDYFENGGVAEDQGLEGAYNPDGTDNQNDFFIRLGRDVEDYSSANLRSQKTVEINREINKLKIKVAREGSLTLQELQDFNNLEKVIKELERKRWATRFTGGIWSLSLRAAAHDVQLNGTGDFFAARIINLTDRLRGNMLVRLTKGIWDPEEGKFKGQHFDLGLRDLFTGMLSKAKDEDLNSYGLRREDVVRGESGNIDNILTMEHLRIGEKSFWEELLSRKLKVKQDQFVIKADEFSKADIGRKLLLSTGGFFQDPSLEGYLELAKGFEHMGTSSQKIKFIDRKGRESKVKTKDGVIRDEEVSGIEVKMVELLERTLEWMQTKKAEEVFEVLGISRLKEIHAWIEKAAVADYITNTRRDFLFKQYLGTSSKAGIQTRVMLDIAFSYLRDAQARTILLSNSISEMIKKLLRYIFMD